MGGHIQSFKLNLTYTVVEGDAQGLGALGRVLGDIAGHLLSRQLPLVAALGDVAHVELLAPAGGQGHALVLVEGRARHGDGRRRPGEPPRSSSSAVNPAGGGATQAGQPQSVAASRRMMAWKWTAPRRWYSATLANDTRTSRRSSALASARQLGQRPVQVDRGPRP